MSRPSYLVPWWLLGFLYLGECVTTNVEFIDGRSYPVARTIPAITLGAALASFPDRRFLYLGYALRRSVAHFEVGGLCPRHPIVGNEGIVCGDTGAPAGAPSQLKRAVVRVDQPHKSLAYDDRRSEPIRVLFADRVLVALHSSRDAVALLYAQCHV